MSQENFINVSKIRAKPRRLLLQEEVRRMAQLLEMKTLKPYSYSFSLTSSLDAPFSVYELNLVLSSLKDLALAFMASLTFPNQRFWTGMSVTAAFLDVSFAYDNVQLSILRNKLHKLKMPVRLSNFIFNLLSQREEFFFFVSVDDPGADLHFRSIIKNVWFGWHTIFTDASKLSEAECVGIAAAWVPDHSGIAAKEHVDLVAKDATSCGNKIPYINYSHDLTALSKKWLLCS
ncbi:hypothetical protein EVAR_102578_1 [Eumeta japonica]|uniref:Uncharacterized protein n=1 Tax=Eumeta variegata TaxID=151549 RepID=A0A4C1SK32_EUMVA|nr:hypothetical protein EVAR_102578_1 [Eumeta japonica]